MMMVVVVVVTLLYFKLSGGRQQGRWWAVVDARCVLYGEWRIGCARMLACAVNPMCCVHVAVVSQFHVIVLTVILNDSWRTRWNIDGWRGVVMPCPGRVRILACQELESSQRVHAFPAAAAVHGAWCVMHSADPGKRPSSGAVRADHLPGHLSGTSCTEWFDSSLHDASMTTIICAASLRR